MKKVDKLWKLAFRDWSSFIKLYNNKQQQQNSYLWLDNKYAFIKFFFVIEYIISILQIFLTCHDKTLSKNWEHLKNFKGDVAS